jgi:lysophospholipase L1-like esterase
VVASEGDAKRRRLVASLVASGAVAASRALGRTRGEAPALTVVTFGDSILDCARYNAHGVHPGKLIVHNDDRLFPEYAGRDLASSVPAHLEHRAVDGARVEDLPRQMRGLRVVGDAAALLTIGGNDLLGGLAVDRGPGIARFARRLEQFLRALPVRPVLIGTVYDPTFGDDARNFLPVDARLARANLGRVNAAIAELAARYGRLVDLHRHFLAGDPSWFTQQIEPSLRGASEVRAAFLPEVFHAATGSAATHA